MCVSSPSKTKECVSVSSQSKRMCVSSQSKSACERAVTQSKIVCVCEQSVKESVCERAVSRRECVCVCESNDVSQSVSTSVTPHCWARPSAASTMHKMGVCHRCGRGGGGTGGGKGFIFVHQSVPVACSRVHCYRHSILYVLNCLTCCSFCLLVRKGSSYPWGFLTIFFFFLLFFLAMLKFPASGFDSTRLSPVFHTCKFLV